jgi:hypothetical protein
MEISTELLRHGALSTQHIARIQRSPLCGTAFCRNYYVPPLCSPPIPRKKNVLLSILHSSRGTNNLLWQIRPGRNQNKCFQGGKGATPPPFWQRIFSRSEKGAVVWAPPNIWSHNGNLLPTQKIIPIICQCISGRRPSPPQKGYFFYASTPPPPAVPTLTIRNRVQP